MIADDPRERQGRFDGVTIDQALDLVHDSITTYTRRQIYTSHALRLGRGRAPDARAELLDADSTVRDAWKQAALVLPAATSPARWRRVDGWIGAPPVTGRDLLLACCERSAAADYRHAFVGCNGETGRLVWRLRKRFPELAVVETVSVSEHAATCDDLVQKLNEAEPDIVWVGLASPQQERWVAHHIQQLRAPAVIGLGAGFDMAGWADAVRRIAGQRWGQRAAVGRAPVNVEP